MNEYGYWLDSREALTQGERGEALTEPRPAWLHLDRTQEQSRKLLKAVFPRHLVDAALTEEPRPRWQWDGDRALLLILRGINFNPGKEAEDMVSLRCMVSDRNLVTLAGQGLKSVKEAAEKLGKPGEGASTWQVLGDILRNLIRGADEHLKHLTEELLDMEGDWLERKRDLRSTVLVLERKLISLRRYLEPQQGMLEDLTDELEDELEAEPLRLLLDIQDRMTRLLESLNLLRERIKLLRDDMNAERDAQMNKTLYLLSIVTALFLPLSVITGYFGMNVGGLPWVEDKDGWLWVSALMGGCFVLSGLLMWWRRWF
ncbi:CorA family divalent cation transporter [Gallaecimonas kandeliae]|uniref:CorA family divalent cation transporter n=1 Tax=Gallaecimonas kandeliae TaxID=3029055 RepID=UPI002649D902|nr:CorA family divalent cation transporter [Gallaecimonas kandeliae]WKE66809.1 CorA family divalent cation transporter [Gallaecimonas kandeliae]